MAGIGDLNAFPCEARIPKMEADEWNERYGMTYRQWLIGMALANVSDWHPGAAAVHAVAVADAVLARLEEETTDA